jgi:hypothetical protein
MLNAELVKMTKEYDYIVFGAGIFGLYAAYLLLKKGLRVALVERDPQPFQRASFINQARLHNGYHYPRSLSTALKSAAYFEKFARDFEFAVNKQFSQIYAVSVKNSYTNAEQFMRFCNNVPISLREINPSQYFKENTIAAAFETVEFAFDAQKIKEWLLEKISPFERLDRYFGASLKEAVKLGDRFRVTIEQDRAVTIEGRAVINATYASVNQINSAFAFPKYEIKYEIAEVALCRGSDNAKDLGITVMDGPFFSFMPFGLTGLQSLTAVEYTPHRTSYDPLPIFPCQEENSKCTTKQLDNCNACIAKPETAWSYMWQLASNYLKPAINLEYHSSLFAIKAILLTAEIDDARPTIIEYHSKNPDFLSVLSGKLNTIYDLEEVL